MMVASDTCPVTASLAALSAGCDRAMTSDSTRSHSTPEGEATRGTSQAMHACREQPVQHLICQGRKP